MYLLSLALPIANADGPQLEPVVAISNIGCSGVTGIAFSKSGKHIVVGCYTEICVWEVATGKLCNKIPGRMVGIDCDRDIVFASYDKHFVDSKDFSRNTTSCWPFLGAAPLWTVQGVGDFVQESFVSEHRLLITTQSAFNNYDTSLQNNILVWDATSGKKKFELPGQFIGYDNERQLIFSDFNNDRIGWSATDGKKVVTDERGPFKFSHPLDSTKCDHPGIGWGATAQGDSIVISRLADDVEVNRFIFSGLGTTELNVSEKSIFRSCGNAACNARNADVFWDIEDTGAPFAPERRWRTPIPAEENTRSGTFICLQNKDNLELYRSYHDNSRTSQFSEILWSREDSVALGVNKIQTLIAGYSHGVLLLDASDGRIKKTIKTNNNPIPGNFLPSRISINHDRTLIFQSYSHVHESAKGFVAVIDVKTEKLKVLLSDVEDLVLGQNMAAYVNSAKELRVCKQEDFSNSRVLFQGVVFSEILFNEKGTILFGATLDSTSEQQKRRILAWEVGTGKLILDTTNETADGYPGAKPLSQSLKQFLTSNKGMVYDANTAKPVRSYNRNLGEYVSMIASKDMFFEGSSDEVFVKLCDLATGSVRANLYNFNGDQDWLVTTSEGYFDGSPGGVKLLSYRAVGTTELIPLERYRKQFEVPGLLAQVWKGEEFRKSKTQKMEAVPIVRITSPKQINAKAGVVEISSGKLTVQATAESRGSTPITELRLKIEGEPIDTPGRIVSFDESANSTVSGSWSLDLKPGKYEMSVVAHDANTYGISDSLTILNLGGGLIRQEKPDLYVLAIGIADYDNGIRKLDYADTDAQAVVKAFRSYSSPLFSKIEVKELIDSKATKDQILEELDWLNRNATERDYVVVYYAGHGKLDRNMYYLLPVNAHPDRLFSTAIDKETLKRGLLNLPGKVLVLFDSCHSGALGRSVESDRGFDGLLKDLNSDENGIAYLSATNNDEEAMENRQLEKGHFTAALIEGLSGQGTPEIPIARIGAGEITYTELERYITKRVKQLTHGRQHVGSHRLRTYHQDFPISLPPK